MQFGAHDLVVIFTIPINLFTFYIFALHFGLGLNGGFGMFWVEAPSPKYYLPVLIGHFPWTTVSYFLHWIGLGRRRPPLGDFYSGANGIRDLFTTPYL